MITVAATKAKNKFNLRVITPTETKVDEQVEMVIMRTISGDMGVLPGHEDYLCVLADGILRIIDDGTERKIAVFGGIAEVKGEALTIITDEAFAAEDIDIERAEQARQELERKLREKADDAEILRDQALLRRALMKIEVSSYSSDYGD